MKGLLGPVGMAIVVAGQAAAQAPGLPVINSGVSRGATIGAQIGFGNDGAGGGTAYGVQVGYGFRRLAVAAFGSGLANSDLRAATSYAGGASLAYRVLGGPLVPVSVNFHAGASYSAPRFGPAGGGGFTAKTWHVPIGLGLSWTFPQPVVAIKPWLSPRADVRRTTTAGPNSFSGTDTAFGLSGGIAFGFLNGLGIDVAFDRVFSQGTGSKPTVIGVGLSYSLK